jgi:hypothetical protein
MYNSGKEVKFTAADLAVMKQKLPEDDEEEVAVKESV